MDVNFTFSEQFLKTLKLMSLNIWVVLKLKFPETVTLFQVLYGNIKLIDEGSFEVALDVLTYQCQ